MGRYAYRTKLLMDRTPHRIFLDTGVVQYLFKYGESIFENLEVPGNDRVQTVPEGLNDIEALQAFCVLNRRSVFELVVSENSFKEVIAAGDPRYTNWLMELADYWEAAVRAYGGSAFDGSGRIRRARLLRREFDYLSKNDRLLIADACEMECDTFLTVDRRLTHSSGHLRRELTLCVVTPTQLWELLQPWAALLA